VWLKEHDRIKSNKAHNEVRASEFRAGEGAAYDDGASFNSGYLACARLLTYQVLAIAPFASVTSILLPGDLSQEQM
jgi:hypothetical protein